MNKSSIEKTLLKGSPKQRALLLANHLSEASLDNKGFLSQDEVTAIANSFQSESELKLYNLYNKRFKLVESFLTKVSQERLVFKISLENLEKYLLLRLSNEEFEDAANSLLDLMPDSKSKSLGAKRLKSFSRLLLFREIKADKGGFISISNKEIEEWIESSRSNVIQGQISLKTTIAAIKDYISETGFKVKAQLEYIKSVENWAKSSQEMILQFMPTIEESNKNLGAFSETGRGVKSLKGRYRLAPDYESVEIDKEVYSRLRHEVLNV